ncbi:MAG TPA: ComEC/Rec2 family competence protein [Thermoanaerobaculia bacterium]|nr:ComEC/Rec2 family competence protein [Thermoanaerobaculia bacterium]HUM28749.1 ComEC/Rec2 family competence protein [Thermoanaerobaculia bacterium]HXK68001.1 ComEC/Rec2 family competence protein [Thermoanaerobaculia bacterium]
MHHPWNIPFLCLLLITLLLLLLKRKPFLLVCVTLCLWSQAFLNQGHLSDGIFRGNIVLKGLWWKGEYDWRIHAQTSTGHPLILSLRTSEDPSSLWGAGARLRVTGEVDTPPPPSFVRWPSTPPHYLRVKSRRLIQDEGHVWWHPLAAPLRWNDWLSRNLRRYESFYPEACGLVQALALGRIWEMEEASIRIFRRSGLMHLLAISGFHVGLLAGILILLALPFRPPPRIAAMGTIVLFFGYIIFTGFRPSVTRAGLMVILYAGSILFRRPLSLPGALAGSLIFSAVLFPETVLLPGFVFTYVATGFIFLLWQGGPVIVESLRTAFCLPICLMPLQGYYFTSITLLSGLLTPFLGLALYLLLPLSLLASLTPGLILPILQVPAVWMHKILDNAASSFLGGYRIPAPSIPITLLAMGGILLLLVLRRDRPFRPLAIAALWLILTGIPVSPKPFVLGVDVGEGLAMAFSDCGEAMLIDTGRGPVNHSLLPVLLEHGIAGLNVLVLTHPDVDHTGAVEGLLHEIPVGSIFLSASRDPGWSDIRSLALQHQIPLRYLSRGDRFSLGSWEVEALWPPGLDPALVGNEGSLVLRVAGSLSVLVAADLPADLEPCILPGLPRTELLQVGHHGSKTSTSLEWLEAIDPGIAYIPVGRRNPFSHPNQNVLSRLRQRGALILRSDWHGTVYVSRSSILTISSSRAFRSLTSW